MTRNSPLPATATIAALKKKGFKEDEGDHHHFTYYCASGKKTSVITKVSHGEREIRPDLVAKMSKQVRLSKDQFRELVECTLSRDGYENLLKETGQVQE